MDLIEIPLFDHEAIVVYPLRRYLRKEEDSLCGEVVK